MLKYETFRTGYSVSYYRYGHGHRENGPSFIWHDGMMKWYQYGNKHRKEGHAVIYSYGSPEFWIRGKRC